MSIEALNWAFKQDLKPTQKFVLVALADCADDYGICFPSHKHIAEKTGFSKSSVRAAISELSKKLLIEKVGRFRGNLSHTSNAYRFPIQDRIDDHPLSPLFKGGVPGAGIGVCHEPAQGERELAQGMATDSTLEAPLNHHITKKEKTRVARDEFLREINKRFKDGFFDDLDITESALNTYGHMAYDTWEGSDKFPKGDCYCYFRQYVRQGIASNKLDRHIKKSTEKKSAFDPHSQWRARMSSWQKGLAWMSQWGAPPDDRHTQVPAAVLAEFKINHETKGVEN